MNSLFIRKLKEHKLRGRGFDIHRMTYPVSFIMLLAEMDIKDRPDMDKCDVIRKIWNKKEDMTKLLESLGLKNEGGSMRNVRKNFLMNP